MTCENKAKRLKNKFQVGQVVYDKEDYQYSILGFCLWKSIDLIRRFHEEIIRKDKTIFDDLPERHCFEYVLECLDPEMNGQKSKRNEYELRTEYQQRA